MFSSFEVRPPSLTKWNSVGIVDIITQMLHYKIDKIYKYCKNIGQIKSEVQKSSNKLRFDDESAFLESTKFINSQSTEKSVEVQLICQSFKVPEGSYNELADDVPLDIIIRLIKACI